MKLLAFIKNNKVIVFALVVVLLSFLLLALPGQFAHYGVDGFEHGRYTFKYNLNGYQWIFATVKKINSDTKIGHVTGYGISLFVLLVLSFGGLLFSHKSSFVSLLTSLALITVAILLFTVSHASLKAYSDFGVWDKVGQRYTNINWVPYVVASLVIIAGFAMFVRTVKVLKSEIKNPAPASKGPHYNYLHK